MIQVAWWEATRWLLHNKCWWWGWVRNILSYASQIESNQLDFRSCITFFDIHQENFLSNDILCQHNFGLFWPSPPLTQSFADLIYRCSFRGRSQTTLTRWYLCSQKTTYLNFINSEWNEKVLNLIFSYLAPKHYTNYQNQRKTAAERWKKTRNLPDWKKNCESRAYTWKWILVGVFFIGILGFIFTRLI